MNDYDVKLKSNGKYWQAWWVQDGERKTESIGAKAKFSRRQADAICRQKAVDLRIGVKRSGGKCPRLSVWVKQYLDLRTDLGDETRTLVEHTGRYLLEYFEQDPPIDRISKLDAASWRSALAKGDLRAANLFPKPAADASAQTKYAGYKKRRKPPKPLSEATVCKHVRCAKRMFEEASGEDGLGLIDRNPFRRLNGKAPKPVKNWATITSEDMARIFNACPSDGWKALFALCRFAGLRRQEALDLQWGDIQWGDNRLTANAHISRVTTKRRPRVMPIEPARCPTGLEKILRDVFSAAREGELLTCAGVQVDNIDKVARAIIAKAGVLPYKKPFHALRKNRATELAMHYPQHVLTEWMGHDADVSETFYLRVDESLYAPPETGKAQKEAQTPSGAPQ